jgi:hypothetical protein
VQEQREVALDGDRDADGKRPHQREVTGAVYGEPLPFNTAFEHLVHGVEEVSTVFLDMKTDQVDAQQAVQQFAVPTELRDSAETSREPCDFCRQYATVWQRCSMRSVEHWARRRVQGQCAGHDAPGGDLCVERVIRTLHEEEIRPNAYESGAEAHGASVRGCGQKCRRRNCWVPFMATNQAGLQMRAEGKN